MSGFYENFIGEGKRLRAAHRGWRTRFPENTLSAFEAAVGRFDLIELDVQLSRDGKWVVIHDETLERTTDVEEKFPDGLRPRRVVDYTLEELRRLDACGRFGAAPCSVPTLEETLTWAAEARMPLNIEIKDMPTREAKRLTRSLIETLTRIPELPPILLSSFNHRYLRELSGLTPRFPLAALVEYTHPPQPIEYLKNLGVEAYHVEEPLAGTTPVEELSEHGIACAVYTVNDAKRARELFDRGFVAIFCDHPINIPSRR
jgi:glycerophosphoryl diester phosphodiesterase